MSENQQEIGSNQSQTDREARPELLLDPKVLLRQIINEARPIFAQNAHQFDSSGVRYNVQGPEERGASSFLGHLFVTNLDKESQTNISYRTESGEGDFDVAIDHEMVEVRGVTPKHALEFLHELTYGPRARPSSFHHNPQAKSLGSNEGVFHKVPALTSIIEQQGITSREISPSETSIDYNILLGQIIRNARPEFVTAARSNRSSGIRYNVDSHEVPDAYDLEETQQQSARSGKPSLLGHLEVTGLDSQFTRVSYRSSANGTNFDIVADSKSTQIVGAHPQEAWQMLSILTNRQVMSRGGIFQYDPNNISLGSSEGITKPTSPLLPSNTPHQLPKPL